MKVVLEVKLRFDTLAEAMEAKTANISREGVFLRSKQAKPLGTIVKLRLEVAAQLFELQGEVVRSDENGMGIHVQDPAPDWLELCARLEKRRKGLDDDDIDIDVSDL
jgi:hypothetical protein